MCSGRSFMSCALPSAGTILLCAISAYRSYERGDTCVLICPSHRSRNCAKVVLSSSTYVPLFISVTMRASACCASRLPLAFGREMNLTFRLPVCGSRVLTTAYHRPLPRSRTCPLIFVSSAESPDLNHGAHQQTHGEGRGASDQSCPRFNSTPPPVAHGHAHERWPLSRFGPPRWRA